MTYINPSVISIDDPKGLDLAIKNVQNTLSTLTWIDKVFGRAWPFMDHEEDGARRIGQFEGIIPKVFETRTTDGKDANYYTVLQNDNLDAFCFFFAEGDEGFENYSSSSQNGIIRPMSLIFWVRLNKVDSTKPYNYLPELKNQVLTVLKKNKNLKMTGFVDHTEDVLQGFNRPKNFNFRYPNVGMRFYFDLQYWEDCPTVITPVIPESLYFENDYFLTDYFL